MTPEQKEVKCIVASSQRLTCKSKRKAVRDLPSVYQNQQEIDDAKRDGTFDINRTQWSTPTGQIYFLCYA